MEIKITYKYYWYNLTTNQIAPSKYKLNNYGEGYNSEKEALKDINESQFKEDIYYDSFDLGLIRRAVFNVKGLQEVEADV